MEAAHIQLADGRLTQSDKLRTYFSGIIEAEGSGEQFPVNLTHIWGIGYATKGAAVKALRKRFLEGVDYTSFIQLVKRETGGSAEEVFMLTVSCAEYFAVRANREVFGVYQQCRQAVQNLMRGTLPDFSNPVAAARAWADRYEAEQRALAEKAQATAQLEAAKPKVEFYDAVQIAAGSMSVSEAAKLLKIAGVGRTKLFRKLKEDKILRNNREPYQQYVDAGYFEVEPQPYTRGEKGTHLASTTRVTPKGLQWLAKRYKEKVSS